MQEKVRTGWTAFAVLLLLAGAGITAFPYIRGAIMDCQAKQAAEAFVSRGIVDPFRNDSAGNIIAVVQKPTTEDREYQKLWEDMAAYNETLCSEKQSGLDSSGAYRKAGFRLVDYGLEDEIFGAISIPAIDLSMPVFLGASAENMVAGAAVMSQTSVPIGGKDTNAVICGHRGWKGAAYFLHIDRLKPGDEVILTNLWEELRYQVVDIKIITPNDIDSIRIQEGRDMITLLSCHPVASGGKQRYLVFCERSE